MKGSLPPNSRTDFLMFSPACFATEEPAFLLPVMETPAIRLWLKILAIIGISTIILLKILLGNILEINFSIAREVPVVLGACFNKMPFPKTRLGIVNLITCHKGKFQGIIPKIIPKGEY